MTTTRGKGEIEGETSTANKKHKLQKFYWHEMEMKLGMRI